MGFITKLRKILGFDDTSTVQTECNGCELQNPEQCCFEQQTKPLNEPVTELSVEPEKQSVVTSMSSNTSNEVYTDFEIPEGKISLDHEVAKIVKARKVRSSTQGVLKDFQKIKEDIETLEAFYEVGDTELFKQTALKVIARISLLLK